MQQTNKNVDTASTNLKHRRSYHTSKSEVHGIESLHTGGGAGIYEIHN